ASIVQLASLKAEELQAEIESQSLAHDFTNQAKRRQEYNYRIVAAKLAVDRFKSRPDYGLAFNDLPELGREYANILIKRQALEPVVIYLQHEVEQTKIDEVRRRSLITVLDPGKIPDVRSSPKRLPMLMLGLFSGFVFAILILATDT